MGGKYYEKYTMIINLITEGLEKNFLEIGEKHCWSNVEKD